MSSNAYKTAEISNKEATVANTAALNALQEVVARARLNMLIRTQSPPAPAPTVKYTTPPKVQLQTLTTLKGRDAIRKAVNNPKLSLKNCESFMRHMLNGHFCSDKSKASKKSVKKKASR